MSGPIRPPAINPCGSCPYRRDVPSGVWDASEYAKLPGYDNPMHEQPLGVFMCHQQDGRLCAGWTGCHDMRESLAIRLATGMGHVSTADIEAILDYTTETPLFGSGAEAAAHGRAEIETPGERAKATVAKLMRKGVAK